MAIGKKQAVSSQNHSKKKKGGGGGAGINTVFGALRTLSRAGVMSRNEEEGEEELFV